MTFRELIGVLDCVYNDDGILLTYHDSPASLCSDTLALFIVSELRDVVKHEEVIDKDDLKEALRAMRVAKAELSRICKELEIRIKLEKDRRYPDG